MKKNYVTKGLAFGMVLVLSLLSACSNGAEKKEALPSTEKTEAVTEAKAEGETKAAETTTGEKEVIKISTTGNHTYFSETNEKTGELQGFEIDVWNEIAKRKNWDIQWEIAGFPGIIELLEAGRVDTVADQIGVTEERKQIYNFSSVYFYVPYRVVVAEDNDTIHGIKDVYGKKLGLLVNDIAYAFKDQFDPDNKIKYVEYDKSTAVHTDVALGRTDASLMSAMHIEDVKQKSGLKIKGVGDPVYTEDAAYPFHKDERGTKLCEEVTEVLKELKEEGFMHETAVKWFGFDPRE